MTQENNGTNWSHQVWQQPAEQQAPRSEASQATQSAQPVQPVQPVQPAQQTCPEQTAYGVPAGCANSGARNAHNGGYRPVGNAGHPYVPYGGGAPAYAGPASAGTGPSYAGTGPAPAGAVPAYAGAAYAGAAPAGPAYAGPAQPDQPKKRGWIVALVAVVLMFVLMFYGMHSCAAAFSSMMDPFDSMMDMSSGSGAAMTMGDTVAVIEMTGTIDYDWTNCSPEGLKYQLDIAENNPDIKAVVLRINSGGGSATAGEEMADIVAEFSKPIVVSSASTNASAAYEISSQTDYIFVGQTTMIGSIGTSLQMTDYSGLYEMLGINIENITSAESKDASYGTRPLTDAEREHYQELVNTINEAFIARVAEGRGMTVEEVRELATGMTYAGIDAVENGLADEFGGLEDALDKAAELAGIDDFDVVYLEPDYTYDLYSLLGMESDTSVSAKNSLFLKEMEYGVSAH